jgi:hypothetical protein
MMASNKVYVQGSYVDVHDNEVVNLSIDKVGTVSLDKATSFGTVTSEPFSREALADAVQAVQAHMWGAAAYAVLFCECRDHHEYPNNMAQFERDIDAIAKERNLTYGCSAGTLSDAFRHNPYLEKHVDKWPDIGVKTRSTHLLQVFQKHFRK